ncbi:MAG: hypothetical protein Q9221_003945 [Calogaya cf. arnoldii]
MRSTYLFAASAAVTSAFAAQAAPEPTVWVTETYTDCSTAISGLATKTNTAVSTYCPHCTEGASPGGASPGSAPTPKGPLTTYTTVYSEICSTGLQPKTYTVTEECSSLGAPRPSNYVPAAFVVTTATCHVCAETPVVATLTTPAPMAPSAAPAGSAPSPAPAVPTNGGSSPAAPSPNSPAAPPSPDSPAAPPSPNSPANAPANAPANPPAAPVAPGAVSQIADGQIQVPTSPASPANPPAAPKAVSPPSSDNGAASPPSSGSSPASPAGSAPASGPVAGPAAKAPNNPAAAPASGPLASGAPVSPYSSAVPFTGSASTLSVSAFVVLTTIMAMICVLAL